MGIELLDGHAHPRHVDLDLGIAVPVGLRNHIGIMGVGHRRDHAKRAAIPAARHVEELLTRIEDDFVIEVDLVGARARSRLRNRIHGVVPARAMLETVPIGRPAEVGRVDVGGEPLFESMQLIGAAIVHFAAEHRPVAGASQIVGIGRHLRREFRGVVVGCDGGNLPPRQEREARGRAQGAVAVEGFEYDSLSREPVDVRSLRDPISVGRQRPGGQLIRHENQEIRTRPHRPRRCHCRFSFSAGNRR